MDNFKIIYKILKALEVALDYDEFDMESISPEVLKISKARWESIMQMLLEKHYVQGGKVTKLMGGGSYINWFEPKITLDGLEFLESNSTIKKASNLAKGIIDVIT
ncbi:MAG: YjcQ family protein [Anaerovoracaceae bacterium]